MKPEGPSGKNCVTDLDAIPEPARGWNLIIYLSGSPNSTEFCEPLMHSGRPFLTNTRKPNAFVQQHAAVTRLTFGKSKRFQTHHLKQALQLPAAAESWCCAFTVQRKGVADPDDTSPAFLKALRPMAKAELLFSFNKSYSKNIVPGIWKEATLLPVKKQASPPGSSSPTDLPASHPVFSRQWREWYTTENYNVFVANKRASESHVPARIEFSESRKPSVKVTGRQVTTQRWCLSWDEFPSRENASSAEVTAFRHCSGGHLEESSPNQNCRLVLGEQDRRSPFVRV